MTTEDLANLGYIPALWIPSAERWYVRPDGLSVCSEEEALSEVAELVGDDERGRE